MAIFFSLSVRECRAKLTPKAKVARELNSISFRAPRGQTIKLFKIYQPEELLHSKLILFFLETAIILKFILLYHINLYNVYSENFSNIILIKVVLGNSREGFL